MSHDPDIERSVTMHKREIIMGMSNKVEELMDMFPGMVKDQSLLYNIAGNIPINEEKMNEIVKLKILRILLDMSYDELRKYLGYEEVYQEWIPEGKIR
jgi:hypothetical protein